MAGFMEAFGKFWHANAMMIGIVLSLLALGAAVLRYRPARDGAGPDRRHGLHVGRSNMHAAPADEEASTHRPPATERPAPVSARRRSRCRPAHGWRRRRSPPRNPRSCPWTARPGRAAPPARPGRRNAAAGLASAGGMHISPVGSQPVLLAAGADEGIRLGAWHAGLLRLVAGVHLHQQLGRAALLRHGRRPARRPGVGRSRLSMHVGDAHRVARLVGLQPADDVQPQRRASRRAARGTSPAASCTRFSPNTVCPAAERRDHGRGRMGLGDGDQGHRPRRARPARAQASAMRARTAGEVGGDGGGIAARPGRHGRAWQPRVRADRGPQEPAGRGGRPGERRRAACCRRGTRRAAAAAALAVHRPGAAAGSPAPRRRGCRAGAAVVARGVAPAVLARLALLARRRRLRLLVAAIARAALRCRARGCTCRTGAAPRCAGGAFCWRGGADARAAAERRGAWPRGAGAGATARRGCRDPLPGLPDAQPSRRAGAGAAALGGPGAAGGRPGGGAGRGRRARRVAAAAAHGAGFAAIGAFGGEARAGVIRLRHAAVRVCGWPATVSQVCRGTRICPVARPSLRRPIVPRRPGCAPDSMGSASRAVPASHRGGGGGSREQPAGARRVRRILMRKILLGTTAVVGAALLAPRWPARRKRRPFVSVVTSRPTTATRSRPARPRRTCR